MKSHHSPRPRRHLHLCTLCLVLLSLSLAACAGKRENAAQRHAFENALKLEQHYSFETAETILSKYRIVIAMEPGTSIAREADQHLQAVEARFKAEEQHKSVFHEHGID